MQKKLKSAYKPKWPIRPELIPVSVALSDQEYCYTPWMGCKSIAGLPPALNSPVPIYTPEWREAL